MDHQVVDLLVDVVQGEEGDGLVVPGPPAYGVSLLSDPEIPLVGEHRPLGGSRRPRCIDDPGNILAAPLCHEVLEAARILVEALSAQGEQLVETHHHRVLEMSQPFHVPNDHLPERRGVPPKGQGLVELLLIFADVDDRARMADHVFALLHRVCRVDADEGRPGGHRPQCRIEPFGLIFADYRHVVSPANAERAQAEGHLTDLLQVFRPADVVPDAEVFPPHRNPSGISGNHLNQCFRQCIDDHGFSLLFS